ncbi:MAG: phage protease, partial [Nitrososphaeraceae archaeon]|nr:phage protease [Nitrososphaeraceae archaeon]
MIRKIHIFRGGPTISSTGKKMVYTESMLQEIVDSYNPDIHEGPVVFGHSGDNRIHFSQPIDGKPAGGWIKGLIRDGLDLYAKVETTPLGEQAISDKLYKKVSASFYSPKMPTSPTPGKWSLRHVALLGAEPPAIKGLKNFVYAESTDNEQELTFLLDEDFAPTKVSELSPIEQLRELYSKFKIQKAKEKAKKDELDKKSNSGTTPTEEPNTTIDTSDVKPNSGDVSFVEYLINANEFIDFVEYLSNETQYYEFKELLMTTKKEDMEYCGDDKKKSSMSFEEEDKETKKKVDDDDKEYSEDPSHTRKIKKPSDKVMLEDLDETGKGDFDLEEDKNSTGESDDEAYDEDIEKTGTHPKPEGKDRHDVGSDKGRQEKDRADSGKGKTLHPEDKSSNYSEDDLLGNNN